MDVINVLMVDDQKEVFDSLKDRARKFRIILHHEKYLPDAIEKLKNDKKLLGVIIDGKGFISRNQVRGDEKEDFVGEMLTQIALIEDREDRKIPKVVLTAWYDELKDSLESRVKVFDKKRIDEDDNSLSQFFDYIRTEIKNAVEYKIRNKYQEVFDVSEKSEFRFSAEPFDSKIFDLLNIYESRTFKNKDFLLIRIVLENIFVGLSSLRFIPSSYFYSTGKPDQSACLEYIKENTKRIDKNNIVPDHIFSCLSFIKYVSNDLCHIDDNTINTKNVFDSCVLATLEVLLWINRKFYKDDRYE